jgi:hypothetical protein
MEDEKAAEQVAVAHAIKHGFYDCNIVSTTVLGPGLSKVVVRGEAFLADGGTQSRGWSRSDALHFDTVRPAFSDRQWHHR